MQLSGVIDHRCASAWLYGAVRPATDDASWHTASGIVVPANVSRVVLPPYSPELNPAERLWL